MILPEERKILVGKVWVGGVKVASTIPKSPIDHGKWEANKVIKDLAKIVREKL